MKNFSPEWHLWFFLVLSSCSWPRVNADCLKEGECLKVMYETMLGGSS